MLGEPLITKEHWQTELAKLALSSIRANLSLLYDSELDRLVTELT